MRTVVKAILKLLGKEDMPIEKDPSRVRPVKSEVMRLISDNTIAREVCGWQTRYSLEQGLAETVEWIRKNIDAYRPESYAV